MCEGMQEFRVNIQQEQSMSIPVIVAPEPEDNLQYPSIAVQHNPLLEARDGILQDSARTEASPPSGSWSVARSGYRVYPTTHRSISTASRSFEARLSRHLACGGGKAQARKSEKVFQPPRARIAAMSAVRYKLSAISPTGLSLPRLSCLRVDSCDADCSSFRNNARQHLRHRRPHYWVRLSLSRERAIRASSGHPLTQAVGRCDCSGGIVGLALAHGLKNLGVQSIVLERDREQSRSQGWVSWCTAALCGSSCTA